MDARERLNGLRVTTVVVELETLGGMRGGVGAEEGAWA